MSTSRLLIRFHPSSAPRLETAQEQVLRGLDADSQLIVPAQLRPLLGDTWSGRRFDLTLLAEALRVLVERLSVEGRAETVVTWAAVDAAGSREPQLEVDLAWPILTLARDLLAMGLSGSLEVTGT